MLVEGPPLPPSHEPEIPPSGVAGSKSPGPAVAIRRPQRSYWLHVFAPVGSSTMSTTPVQQSLTILVTWPSAFLADSVIVGRDEEQTPKSASSVRLDSMFRPLTDASESPVSKYDVALRT